MNAFKSLFLSLATSCLALAQEPVASPLVLKAITYVENFESLRLRSGGQETNFKVPPYLPAGEMIVPRGKRLEFVADRLDTEGKKISKVVAATQIPTDYSRALLLFTPSSDPAQTNEYQLDIIPDDYVRFPSGTVRFINISPLPIALLIGTETIPLKYGESKIIKPETDSRFRAVLKAAYSLNGEWVVFHDNIININPNIRTTCIIAFSKDGFALWQDASDIKKYGKPPASVSMLSFVDPVPKSARQIAANTSTESGR